MPTIIVAFYVKLLILLNIWNSLPQSNEQVMIRKLEIN